MRFKIIKAIHGEQTMKECIKTGIFMSIFTSFDGGQVLGIKKREDEPHAAFLFRIKAERKLPRIKNSINMPIDKEWLYDQIQNLK